MHPTGVWLLFMGSPGLGAHREPPKPHNVLLKDCIGQLQHGFFLIPWGTFMFFYQIPSMSKKRDEGMTKGLQWLLEAHGSPNRLAVTPPPTTGAPASAWPYPVLQRDCCPKLRLSKC